MSVLIDTNVWSFALRRRRDVLSVEQQSIFEEWSALATAGVAALIGPIRQELLSGIRDGRQFEYLRNELRGFDVLPVELDDYDRAAMFCNACRARGVAGDDIDLLICSIAAREDIPVFTMDPDFERYAEHLPIELYRPS